MVTAVDTSVLLDVFCSDSQFGETSADALRTSLREGRVVVCDVVLAELSAAFPSKRALEKALGLLPLDFLAMQQEAAVLEGHLWRR